MCPACAVPDAHLLAPRLQYFTFLRTCCSWCSGGRVSTMFGMLTTMTFYTSILSLALAGPLQSALSDYVGGLVAGVAPGADAVPAHRVRQPTSL